MIKVPFVDLALHHQPIRAEIDAAIARVVSRGDFIQGDDVRLFEQEFADFCGVTNAVGCSSGTAALHMALLGCGIQPGDEVITAPHTFIATAEAIFHAGARVVFADIESKTYTIDPDQFERAITEKTKAIVVVHIYGQCADMDRILSIANRYGVKVIEDAAQAHGALYRGKPAGSMGDAGCFSFFPGKNLGAFGDAGIVVTNDADMADRMRAFGNHGRREKYEHFMEGYNYRLDTLQAAILRVKLPYLQRWNELRRSVAARYSMALDAGDVVLPHEEDGNSHVYHLYVIRTRNREQLRRHLAAGNIASGIHYPVPLHLQGAYKHLYHKAGDYPVAERVAGEILSLPIFPEMSAAQSEHVSRSVLEFAALCRVES